jgi:hypothetical protein
MKGLLLGLALVLSAVVLLFPAKASAGPNWYCTVQPGQLCIGGYNNWNHHYVQNLGGSAMLCGSFQPNGQAQSSGWVYPGGELWLAAWSYNHIVCYNATAQTTLHILSYI